MNKLEENNKKDEELSLYKFCALAPKMNKDNEYYIIRKNDNLVYNLGKIVNFDVIS